MKRGKRVGVLHMRFDPFRRGHEIKPFAIGVLWDDGEYCDFWGDDCIPLFVDSCSDSGPAVLYSHNGGRFDFIFLREFIHGDILNFDGRIVTGKLGNIELRDSFLIIPRSPESIGVNLGIDDKKFERSRRELFKTSILKLLKDDCEQMLAYVLEFRELFGDAMTVSSAACKALTKIHKAENDRAIGRLDLKSDRFFRQFFFGGRNEAFEKGLLKDDWKYYDVRSMYPGVMRDFVHPTGVDYLTCRDLSPRTDFAIIDATSRGAFPARRDDGGVEYPDARREFYVTGHELQTAMELKLVTIHRVIMAYEFSRREDFAPFVHEYGELRMAALRTNNYMREQMYKDVLNRAFGKQAIDVEKMGKWQCCPHPDNMSDEIRKELDDGGFTMAYIGDNVSFWHCPLSWVEKVRTVRNVACAASITGAARARVQRALAYSDRPAYVDTDGIICRELGERTGDSIGSWRQIDSGDMLAIAGRKKYALFDRGEAKRFACAGAALNANDIMRMCGGETIVWNSQTPVFSVSSDGYFVDRTMRAS